MNHIKQLDSLRAIAVLLVVLSHYGVEHFYNFYFGPIGVNIFFVLSGFLITRILMVNKNEAEELGTKKLNVFKSFFIRRTLRIFPIYYLTIFLLYILDNSTYSNIRSAFTYYLTYTSNFYFFKTEQWDAMLAHLWSLAVEEQFYLFWPWLILFLRKKYLLPAIVIFISIGVLSSYFLAHVPFSSVLTFYRFDTFGFGALLSWLLVYKPSSLAKIYKALSLLACISFVLFIMGGINKNFVIIEDKTLISIIVIWLITYIVYKGQNGQLRFSFILNNKTLFFIGKISYGIYLYHLILPRFTFDMLWAFNKKFTFLLLLNSKELLYVETFLLTILLSWLSWIVVEQPILRLKKYFEYQQSKQYIKTKETLAFAA